MPASIFAGSKVKTLKSTLSLNGGADIISSATNPQTSAIDAVAGSLLLNTTTGIMYRKLDAGSTTNWVEVGSGAGQKNYIKNPDFDGGQTTNWAMRKVSLSSLVPTGNIGAADAGHSIAASSSSPLEGANSLLVQGASLFTAGNCLVSDAFAIDREDQAKVMGWSFYYEAVTTNMDFPGTSAGTWAVYIAEVTTATPDTVVSWIQPAGVYNLVQSSGAGIASGTFQTTAAGTAYRLVLVCINSEAAATTLKVDDFQLGPQKVLQGPSGPVGEIIATGSITPPQGFLYCNGQSVSVSQYQDLFNSIGYTYGGAGASFNVPDLRGVFLRGAGSQTIGAETYTGTLGVKQNDATAKNGLSASTSGADGTHTHEIRTNSTNFYINNDSANFQRAGAASGIAPSVTAGTQYAFSTTTNSAHGHAVTVSSTDTETHPANVAVAYHIRYLATYQMSQDTDTRVVAFSTKSVTSGTYTHTLNANFQNLPAGFWGTPSVNTHGTWDSATNGGEYVVPVSGTYKIQAQAGFAISSTGIRTGRILIDGVEVARAGDVVPTAGSTPAPVVWYTASLNAGQRIRIQFYQNSAGNLDYYVLNNGVYNILTIERLSGPATIASSETVAMRAYASGGQTLTTSTSTIQYNNKTFDSHAAFNTSNYTFTAPISGTYLVSAKYYMSNNTPCYIGINGLNYSYSLDGDANGKTYHITDSIQLLAGQTVTIGGQSLSGSGTLGVGAGSREHTLTIVRVGN